MYENRSNPIICNLIVLNLFIFPIFASNVLENDASTTEESQKPEMLPIKKTKSKLGNDSRIYHNNSFPTLHQKVHASKYVVKGTAYGIVYKKQGAIHYDYSAPTEEETNQSTKYILLKVKVDEILYSKEDAPRIETQVVNFLYTIRNYVATGEMLSRTNISDKYIGRPAYYFCRELDVIDGPDGELPLCRGLFALPPVNPLPVDIKSNLERVIKKEQKGEYPMPTKCIHRMNNRKGWTELEVFCNEKLYSKESIIWE
ncbi:MAG: hypothetical protein GKR93_09870 [Gammaproteobacteria bacterium]|nr:hypothetical protein [Gammaproteobacteria bacterium]